MSRSYPALDLSWAGWPDDESIGGLLAALDDSRPTAVEERHEGLRVFFASTSDRTRGQIAIQRWNPDAVARAIDVADEDWAARSQAALGSVRIGRLHIAPPWDPLARSAPLSDEGTPPDLVVIIQPSMGFGTGHHASTRLCLALVQESRLAGRSVLDVGTGSGVLALAAWKLGAAAPVVAIDLDPDALTSARENADLNGATEAVQFHLLDFRAGTAALGDRFDHVTANLTGTLIGQTAPALAALVAPGGTLIASGFQHDEEASVTTALRAAGLRTIARREEEGWIGIECLKQS